MTNIMKTKSTLAAALGAASLLALSVPGRAQLPDGFQPPGDYQATVKTTTFACKDWNLVKRIGAASVRHYATGDASSTQNYSDVVAALIESPSKECVWLNTGERVMLHLQTSQIRWIRYGQQRQLDDAIVSVTYEWFVPGGHEQIATWSGYAFLVKAQWEVGEEGLRDYPRGTGNRPK